MDKLDSSEILAAFASELEDIEAELVVNFAMAVSGEPKARIASTVKRYSDEFREYLSDRLSDAHDFAHEKICVEMNYCERIKNDRNALAFSIADTVIISVFGLKFPPITLAVFLIRIGIFDDYCGCMAVARKT